MRESAAHCTWFPWCAELAAHEVERCTPEGVVLRELVCDRHLPNAREHDYQPRVEGREQQCPRPS
jgi:hypothetical protein